MFYIDPLSAPVVAAEEQHYQRFSCYIRRKLDLDSCDNEDCPICKSGIEPLDDPLDGILAFLSDETKLTRILRGKPDDLLLVTSEFWSFMFDDYNYQVWQDYFNKRHRAATYNGPHAVNAKRIIRHLEQLKSIFNYDWFIDKSQNLYNAYSLTAALSRNTCTYCNRSYTATVIRKKTNELIIRPTLDHWFPKFNHPLLAVSFFNLIPSCYACNSSVKGFELMDLTDHVHPYMDPTQTSDFEFGYTYHGKLDAYRVFLKTAPGATDRARNTLKGMRLDEVYNTHYGELSDLLTIRKNYSGSYIESIKKILGGKLSTPEVYRLVFGTEYKETDFHKRPLSKFKHDILRQMGLLEEKDKR